MTPIPIATGWEREARAQVIIRERVPMWVWAVIIGLGIVILIIALRR